MKGKSEVYCESCSGEITEANDLIVTSISTLAEPYHAACHEKKIGEMSRISRLFYMGGIINGMDGNIDVAMSLIYNLILLFVFGIEYWPVIVIISAFVIWVRLYSWFKYERALKPAPKEEGTQSIVKGIAKSLKGSLIAVTKLYIIVIASAVFGKLAGELIGSIL